MQKIHMKPNINIQLTNVKNVDSNHYDDPKAYIKYSNDMQDVYENIEECNIGKKRKIPIVLYDCWYD